MNASRAWQTVLDQLEQEMAKTTFDTWVKETQAIMLDRDTLTVGVSNQFARDWLENRVTSYAARVLTGVLDQQTEVHFVVTDPVAPVQRDRGHANETAQEDFVLPKVHIVESLHNVFVQPGKAHVSPAYVLRWVPYLPSTAFWIWMGYRQAYFDQYHGTVTDHKSFNVSSRRISEIVGIDRKTIETHRKKEWFKWFLTFESTERYIFKDGAVMRDSFPYTFVSTAPPTPGDHDRLIQWLADHNFERSPIAVLEKLLHTPASEILQDPAPKPTAVQKKRKPRELTFSKAILEECDLTRLEENEIRRVIDLANAAESYLVDSFGLLYIPLYFMKHWVQTLKATPALAVTIIRHTTGYYNAKTHEIRNAARLKGGMAGLANKLGLSTDSVRRFLVTCQTRPPKDDETISSQDVLLEKKRKEKTRDLFTQFVEVEKVLDTGDLKLKLSMIDPLHPEDQIEYDAAVQIISKFFSAVGAQCTEQHITKFTNALADYGLFGNMKDSPIEDMKVYAIEDMKVFPNGDVKLSPIEDTKDSSNDDMKDSTIPDGVGNETFTQFKYFNYLSVNTFKDYLIHITNNRILSNTSDKNESPLQENHEPTLIWLATKEMEWGVANILKHANLDPHTKKQITETISPQTLVSYILYVFGPEKDSFNAPWQFIRTKLTAEHANVPMPGKVSFLSNLSPHDLANLMAHTEESWAGTIELSDSSLPGAKVWKQYIRSVESIYSIYEIAEILGLSKWS